ncbi:MAG: hypothetical protein AAGE92_06690, partial [Cyanobacteria bacterium P01_G01_bin.4]
LIVGNIHEKALAGGLSIVDQEDAYQLALSISDAADLTGEKYFTDPATVPPQPPPPDYTAMALEIEKLKADNEALDEVRKAELEKYKVDLNARVQIALKELEVNGKFDVERLKGALTRDAA